MAENWKKALAAVKDPEKRAKLEVALSEVGEFADELDKGYMRQEDFSKKSNELAERRAKLEENWETANAQYKELLAENEQIRNDVDSTRAEKEEAARKLKEAEEKLKATPQIDPAKFLTNEDFEKKQRETAVAQTAYFSDVLDIAEDHQELFGKRLKPRELIKEAIAAGKTPVEYWEEKYKVPEKRAELAATEEKRKSDEAEKRGYEKRLAEEANPNTRTFDSSKNPFYETAKEGKSLQPWDEESSFDAEKDFVKELQQARG